MIFPKINPGEIIEYSNETLTDCRSAYGKALLSLAQKNTEILAATADLGGSVMTKFVAEKLPNQFLEFGIAEQNMISVCGGLSLSGFVPFCSTFGAFMSSRAKDQARVNDINQTNVKMVATHCGLSVGEDGPTHQAIDDAGSFVGFFNTKICEPADPNHCDRIIRFVAKEKGNFYVRMGRSKLKTLTTEKGEIFFNKDYQYSYGKTDILRSGENLTVIATGAAVHEILAARNNFSSPEKIEIVIASSIKKFDQNLENSIRKTGKILTVEDHNPDCGLGAGVAKFCTEKNLSVEFLENLGPKEYQLSGKPEQLYENVGISANKILEFLEKNYNRF